MVETAAHLTDHVFPRLPVRQWVLCVPKRLRHFMQRDGAALNMVLRIFLRVISQSLQTHSTGGGSAGPCHLTHARICAAQTFPGALPVGGADSESPETLRDRPQLRAANQLCPQLIESSRCCARCVVDRCA